MTAFTKNLWSSIEKRQWVFTCMITVVGCQIIITSKCIINLKPYIKDIQENKVITNINKYNKYLPH